MHRDLSKYIATEEDRLTVRKWTLGFAVFYGLLGVFLVGTVAARNYHADAASHTTSPASVTVAANGNRSR